jgi:single-stranded-DNA-specific exonuclease
MPDIARRVVDEVACTRLTAAGIDPRLARLFAARGVTQASELATALPGLAAPKVLAHAEEAAALLADAIEHKLKLLIVADYDADGATACAVGLRALRAISSETSKDDIGIGPIIRLLTAIFGED